MDQEQVERTLATPTYDYDQVEACSTEEHQLIPLVKTMIFAVVFALGLCGNVTVLWVLLRVLRVKTMTDVCLLNLALSDLLMVLSLPVWAVYVHHHITSDAMCKSMAGLYQVAFYSGIFFVTLMSVDRYLAIVHAVAVMGARTRRHGIALSLVFWTFSVCAAVPEAVFASVETEENITTCRRAYSSGSERTWKLLRNFGENAVTLVCLPVLAFCYVRVLWIVRRTKSAKKKRAVKLIVAVVALFVMSWVPYGVAVFLRSLQEFGMLTSCASFRRLALAVDVTQMVALTHCGVNPLVYAFAGEKFRKTLASAFSRHVGCVKAYRSASSQSRGSDNETSNIAL